MNPYTISKYGTEHLGRLKKAMLHKPSYSLNNMNFITAGYYLFDSLPDVDKYLEEHERYKKLLQSYDIEVFELSDYVTQNTALMNTLPSLPYLHDIAVITKHGAILSKMGWGRTGEDTVVHEALANLGVPIYHQFQPDDHFEGCLALSPKTLLIACTERHRPESIERFIPHALKIFDEIIYTDIPKARRFMHPDMVYNLISENLALVFLPAFLKTYQITRYSRQEIDFKNFMHQRNIELINVSDEEQQKWGCSFVPLEPNIIIHYDISLTDKTIKLLSSRGVEIIQLHPEALLAGGGSLRCLTMQLLREKLEILIITQIIPSLTVHLSVKLIMEVIS